MTDPCSAGLKISQSLRKARFLRQAKLQVKSRILCARTSKMWQLAAYCRDCAHKNWRAHRLESGLLSRFASEIVFPLTQRGENGGSVVSVHFILTLQVPRHS
jgi:hypothetical protein